MERQSRPSTHAAIAAETIASGGLAHYTLDLDRALRTYAGQNQILDGPAFCPPPLQEVKTRNGAFRRVLRARPHLVRFVRRLRRSAKPDPWRQVRAWTKHWQAIPDDTVAILPHVVIQDQGKMDPYYAEIARRPFVWVIHDLNAFHFPSQWPDADVELMRRRFQFLNRHAGRVIVHNEFTAQDVSEKLKIERSRISIVLLPSFFSGDAFPWSKESDAACLAHLGIRQPYGLWASSSTQRHKNHERLLHAWRILVDRNHPLQLACTGYRDPRWGEVQECIRKLRLDAHVCFTGIVSDPVMAVILRNAHFAVCPTLFEGGGPGPAAEAMMAGIPLTASDIPQCRQLFNLRKDLCTFFDPHAPDAIAAAVEEIVLDYGRARTRAEFARAEYGKMRTWEAAARQYWQAVEAAREAWR